MESIDQIIDPETRESLAEDAGNIQPARASNSNAEAEAEKPKEDVLDTLVPKADPREWLIGQGEYQRKYVQKPLSFIAKMQWFALVGEVLDKAMSGPNPLTLGNLMSGPGVRGNALSMDDFRDADTFIQAVGKLVAFSPSFLQQSYCIWLNVPQHEREIVMEEMALPEDEGGLSDDDGWEIVQTFLDQNYEAIDRFFREKLPQLQSRVQAHSRRLQDQ